MAVTVTRRTASALREACRIAATASVAALLCLGAGHSGIKIAAAKQAAAAAIREAARNREGRETSERRTGVES